MNPRVVLIVAGGTGGHLYPGIATARALVNRSGSGGGGGDLRPVFAVRRGDLGKGVLSREGFEVVEISGQGLPRAFSWKVLTLPYRLVAGIWESWKALRHWRPVVVLGMGGYLSFPVLMMAKVLGIKTVIHEQNVLPGLSNRFLGRWVDSVAVSFPESQRQFRNASTWVSGLPLRADIGGMDPAAGRARLGLDPHRTTFLVFGGSLGAQRLNEAVARCWGNLSDRAERFQVIHITGERGYDSLRALYRDLPLRAVVMPYCHDMAAAYAAADWVLCRAGASTIAELLAAQKPATLIPYPFAAADHQRANATILVQRGVADMILDQAVTPESLTAHFRNLLDHPERIHEMRTRFSVSGGSPVPGQAAERLAAHLAGLGGATGRA